jgi:NAD+ diphosphatase
MDPAIITLPTFGEFALLAHNRRWNDGRFSAVAGFVELGESFEQACHRELLEETGLKVCVAWGWIQLGFLSPSVCMLYYQN